VTEVPIHSGLTAHAVACCFSYYGYRKQLSVFLCRLGTTQYVKLRTRLYDIIDLGADQVLFIPLCPRCVAGMEAMGRPTDPPEKNDVVMVL